ncbi:MAG: hypothetical protein ACPHIA_02340, partial [Alphaproteobacteria bacterium]
FCLAAARAQMNVRDPDRPVAGSFNDAVHSSSAPVRNAARPKSYIKICELEIENSNILACSSKIHALETLPS